MQKRFIDANALEAEIEKTFRKLITNQSRPDLTAALSYAGDLIIEAPTVDAVEVVRCKDCDWYKEHEGSICVNPKCVKSWYGCPVPKEHFCSYGERSEGE